MMATVIRSTDNRGGLAYPFLPAEWHWQIVSRPLADDDTLSGDCQPMPPTLRWVKDDKVLDLYVPGLDTAAFSARTGLQLSMSKGGYVLSKQLSRVMRPYRYWGFFNEDEVTIDYNEFLNGRLWYGCGQVSRSFVQRLADSQELDDRHRHELLHTNRFEVTTLHAGGQDKGHLLVIYESTIQELKNFAIGLERDSAAVYEAIRQSWSNGPTEGHVNRLKFLKRQGYGRASFNLLRLRVLLADS
jgi:hypothetical protein